MNIGIGSIARIGQLYPSAGLCDHEIQWMAPEGVRFITTRVPFRTSSLESDRAFSKDLETPAQLLADADVQLLAVNCTAATLLAGPDNIRQRLTSTTGLPVATTIEAVIQGCQAMDMKRIALITPYPAEVVDAEVAYLASQGITVTRSLDKPCHTPLEQASLPPSFWLGLARQLNTQGLDGVLVSCAGIQVADVIAPMEQLLSLPVVTSNQALLWQCLRHLGLEQPIDRFGRLLGRR